MLAGITIKPGTPVELLLPYIAAVDMVRLRVWRVAVQGGRNMPVQLFKLQPCCRTRCIACGWACHVCRLT